MKPGLIRSLAGLLILISIDACTLPYSSPRLSPPTADFPGINDALILSGSNKTVDVVLVHGMCTHTPEWVTDTNQALAKALQMTLDGDNKPIPIGNLIAGQPAKNTAQLYVHHLTGRGYTVNTFAILWSPISDAAKAKLCYDSSAGNANCPAAGDATTGKRVLANRYLKETLLDNCLADAVYYAGNDGRNALQTAIRQGVSTALFGDPTDLCGTSSSAQRRRPLHAESRTPIVFITESLGSKMLYDTLVETLNTCDIAGHAEFSEALQGPIEVFMAANQLPILSLAYSPRVSAHRAKDLSKTPDVIPTIAAPALGPVLDVIGLSPGGGVPSSSVRRTMLAPDGQPSTLTPKWVVAFSDPNDLFSYTLRSLMCTSDDDCAKPNGTQFSDVLVSNDRSYLFVIENPETAHTTYLNRTAIGIGQQVEKLIVCGGQAFVKGCEPPPGS